MKKINKSRFDFFPVSVCAAISLLLTAALYSADRAYSKIKESEIALSLVRQISAQVIGLTQRASSLNIKGEGKSRLSNEGRIRWATEQLNIGVEPRRIKIFPAKVRPALAKKFRSGEFYEYEAQKGLFDYARLVFPETSDGLRISVELGFRGFLGARSRLASDVIALFVALVIYFLSFMFLFRDRPVRVRATVPVADEPETEEDSTRRIAIRSWIGEAKLLMVEMTRNVREIIQHMKKMALASDYSKKAVVEMRRKFSHRVSHIQECRQVLHQLTYTVRTIREIRSTGIHVEIEKASHLLEKFEGELAPLKKELDGAVRAYDGVLDARDEMIELFTETTHSISNQLNQVSKLRKIAEDKSDSVATSLLHSRDETIFEDPEGGPQLK